MGDRPIVGRASELSRLREAWSAVRQGRGGVALVGGDPGIGKTRLARELCELASADGARVGWGRCVSADDAPEYWPISEALDELRVGDEAFENLGDAERSVLSPLVPRWARTSGPGADAGHSRFALARALTRLLEALGRTQPIVIVIDDVHAIDYASLALLELVAPTLDRTRVMLVLTHRLAEVQALEDIARGLGRIAREAVQVAPTPLSEEDVRALLAEHGITDPQVGHTVFTTTQGNPLFVHEIGTSLARKGTPGLDPGDPLPLPWGVRDAVRQRLATVGDETRVLLEIVALSRDAIAPAALASVSELGADQVARALAEAIELGVLDERNRFTHPLLREVLQRDLPPSRSMALHRRLADELAAQQAGGAAIRDATLAHHLLGAGPGHVAAAAVRAIAGAKTAVGVSAWEDAVRLLQRVVATLPTSPETAGLQVDLRLALGDAYILSGRHDEGERVCDEASAIARQSADGRRLALAALTYGRIIRPGLSSRRLRELLEEALAALPADQPELRARALARLAAVRQPEWDAMAPIALAREAFELAGDGVDPRTRLDVLYSGMAALADYADPAERKPLNTECVRLAVELGDKPREFRGRMRLTFDLLELGDPTSARHEAMAVARIATELESEPMRFLATMVASAVAGAVGDVERAHALARQAMAIADAAEVPGAGPIRALHALAWKLHDGSEPLGPDVIAGWEAAVPGGRFGTAMRCTIQAALAAADGALARARQRLDEVEPAYFERLLDPMELAVLCVAARTSGWTKRDADIDAQLQRMGERWESFGLTGMACFGPLARHRRRTPADAPPSVEPAAAARMELDGETWVVQWGGRRVRLRNRRGEQLLAALIERPDEEVHVLELVGGDKSSGDAGPVLDEQARRQYRERLRTLGERLEAAKARGDEGAAVHAEEELEALHGELARAFGLGGRARRSGSPAERARVLVRKRIAEALQRVAALDPEVGAHLQRRVRTGMFCVYRP